MTPNTIDAWLKQAPTQSLIITANERLSRAILECTIEAGYFDTQVMSLSAFINQHWEDAQNNALHDSHKHLLSTQQAIYIWQQLVAQHTSAQENIIDDVIKDDFLMVTKLFEAYNTDKQWQLPEEALSFNDNKHVDVYQTLKTHFEKTCISKNWITAADAAIQLTTYFETEQLTPYSQLGLYGFNDLSPAEQALLDKCSRHISIISLPPKTPHIHGQTFEQTEDEITAIALWAKNHIEDDPKTNIGIVIPNLHKKKSEIETIFSRVFKPYQHAHISPVNTAQLPYEVTLGNKLIDEPVIHSLFLLLSIHNPTLDKPTAHSLLNSPFWGEANSLARAHAMLKLSNWDRSKLSTTQFIDWLNISEPDCDISSPHKPMDTEINAPTDTNAVNKETVSNPPYLTCHKSALQALTLLRQKQNAMSPLAVWRDFLHDWLKALNWPGVRTVNSREYQAVMMFMALLDELKDDDLLAIDTINKSYSGFISHLKSKAYARVFKVQTEPKPIKVMGTLEAIGLHFDHCWVANVSTDQFPEKPTPNPFLPYSVQKEYGTPRASAEKELLYAQTVLSGFCQNANNVTFSFSRHSDNSEQLPTPILKDQVAFIASQPNSTPLSEIQQQQRSQPSLVIKPMQSGSPLNFNPNDALKSGINVIENTAINPFWAYFIHRLGAQQPVSTYVGLSPIDKGMIIHDVAAKLWHDHPNKQALETLLPLQNNQDSADSPSHSGCTYIESQVQRALLARLMPIRGLLPKALLHLEKARMVKAILAFLLQDIQRPDFDVQAVETRQKISFKVLEQTITFHITLDRVDRMPNDQIMVTDYKTGKSDIIDTLKQPLANAQLPVYSLIEHHNPVNAVSFAFIATHGAGYSGMGELSDPIEGIDQAYLKKWTPTESLPMPESFDDLKAHWNTLVCDYLSQFCQGDATYRHVTFKAYHAYLAPLTRQFEQDYLQQIQARA